MALLFSRVDVWGDDDISGLGFDTGTVYIATTGSHGIALVRKPQHKLLYGEDTRAKRKLDKYIRGLCGRC